MSVYPNHAGAVNNFGTSAPFATDGENASISPEAQPKRPFTRVDNAILDRWMPLLTGAEFKLVLFIARRTAGWNRDADDISLDQLAAGTGLSRETVRTSIPALIAKGILLRHRHKDSRGGDLPPTYSLNFSALFGIAMPTGAENPPLPPNHLPNHDRNSAPPPVATNLPHKIQSPTPNPAPASASSTPPTGPHLCGGKQHIQHSGEGSSTKSTKNPVSENVAGAAESIYGTENAIALVTALGIAQSDAESIVSEVGAEIATQQAIWWPQRKTASTARELGASFRTACRREYKDPNEKKAPTPKPPARPAAPARSAAPADTNANNNASPRPNPAPTPKPPAPTRPAAPMLPIWRDALAKLSSIIHKPTMETHIKQLSSVSYANGQLVLEAPSAFTREWIGKRHLKDIEQAVAQIAGSPVTVHLVQEGKVN